jgi:hypothetical protein
MDLLVAPLVALLVLFSVMYHLQRYTMSSNGTESMLSMPIV